MCRICVFAGTSEGRELISVLVQQGVSVYACTATEYGGVLLDTHENLCVSSERLTREEMCELFVREMFDCVVDATHPYAAVVTENIFAACKDTDTRYLRLNRETNAIPEQAVTVSCTQEAVEFLTKTQGTILLTTGSKELVSYSAIPDFKDRVYARVLPIEDSITLCKQAGLSPSHIIAMQGPFSREMNTAMLMHIGAKIMVTKESGQKGGFQEKVLAARDAGAMLVVIGRPQQVAGKNYLETLKELSEMCHISIPKSISIVGIGPGNRDNMTIRADEAIKQAECLIGAKRMLSSVASPNQTCVEAISPDRIFEVIQDHPQYHRFAVVMSGDIGFYSGTKKLLPKLKDYSVELIPGISSLVYLCSQLGVSYEDIVTVSLHGRNGNIASSVSKSKRIFTLVGGENGMHDVCKALCDAGMHDAKLSVGENLGYENEIITCGSASELLCHNFSSLSVAIIEYDADTVVTHGMPDELFQRGNHADGTVVPMTKSEIRAIALSKLQLRKDSVCWDIGAGTGSVSIEMGLAASDGFVYAIEKNTDAVSLLKANIEKHRVGNLFVVPGAAPDACSDLPAPTHVFIGGSSGNLKDIILLSLKKNPHVRIVATAIALESVSQLMQYQKEMELSVSDVACITVAQGRKAGSYTLMQGQNPVYVFTLQK